MHRLFWKLFLSFWIALVLFATGVVLATSSYLDFAQRRFDSDTTLTAIERLTSEAQIVATRYGMAGLRQWARERDNDQLIPLLAVARTGRELLGREVPNRLMNRLLRYMNGRDASGTGRRTPVVAPSGEAYWLILDYDGVSLRRLVSRPQIVAAEIILGAFIGALVCWLLARYITAPIERLRRAVQAYGEGDFTHRVRPLLGRRRDEIADLAMTMDAMAERLEVLLKSHRILLRDVSHELRSPLARVQAALGLARQRQGKNIEAELDRIERETERVNDLIGGILSFSRLDSGAHQLQRQEIRLDRLVASAVEDAHFQAENECEIRFENLAGEVTCQIDVRLFASALENVLANALRYAASAGRIEVKLDRQNDTYLVSVADHGPGIPEPLLQGIFEPFVRVDASRSSKMGGVGLGLAIAKRSMEALGGRITAINRPAGGLEVTMSLPA